MESSYVFISYSQKDREFILPLIKGLNENGIKTWTDLENIRPGVNWDEEIETGLLNASAFIYVSSKNSVQSAWVDQELKSFIGLKKNIIPIVLDEEGASNMPLYLRRLQWVNFSDDFDTALNLLVKGLHLLIGDSPVKSQVLKSKGYAFISYADEDATFVLKLKDFLKGKGYAYWDFRESKRDYQSDYSLELEGVITNAVGTLSVISPDWKKSPITLQELHFSREIKKPVFLLKVKDPGPTLAISGMTYIDFTSTYDTGFLTLDDEMKMKGL